MDITIKRDGAEIRVDGAGPEVLAALLSASASQPADGQELVGHKIIVRGSQCGVHYGRVVAITRDTIRLEGAIRIFYWDGAASLSELAEYGPAKPNECRFGVRVKVTLRIADICEFIAVSDEGARSIEAVPSWRVPR